MTSQSPPATDGPGLEVVEYTDPLCPWAWGSEPTFRRLRAALDGRARWRRAYAVLFDEGEDPAPDPAAETAWYARYVERISAHTRAPRAARPARVAASSWPASLVAAAAEAQGSRAADRVLRRLRESMFVTGSPADTLDAALCVAAGVPGLDAERLRADAASDAVRARVRADHAEARRPVPEVLRVDSRSPHPGAAKEDADGQLRYALPTVLFRTAGGRRVVPGWRPYDEYAAAVEELSPGLLSGVDPVLPAPRALRHHRSLTGPESRALTTGPWPPADAVRVDTAGGPLWLLAEEARVYPTSAQNAPDAP
ncbi:DsbA family protein [Streptomyces sp. NPDC006552]|uniref:DsbA family oxidoreductase n=1 Tax=Streptomyces sp. NPDC006552 TaxID=3157179 RepID=UPI0033A67EB0